MPACVLISIAARRYLEPLPSDEHLGLLVEKFPASAMWQWCGRRIKHGPGSDLAGLNTTFGRQETLSAGRAFLKRLGGQSEQVMQEILAPSPWRGWGRPAGSGGSPLSIFPSALWLWHTVRNVEKDSCQGQHLGRDLKDEVLPKHLLLTLHWSVRDWISAVPPPKPFETLAPKSWYSDGIWYLVSSLVT